MKVAEFWAWFLAHHEELRRNLEEPDDDLANVVEPLRNALAAHGIPLSFQFGVGEDEDGPRPRIDLEFTADGDLARFPQVEALVAAAPKVDGWAIIAFRQPAADPTNIRVDYGTPSGIVTLSTANVLFQFASSTPDRTKDGRLVWAVDLFVPGGRQRGKDDPRIGAVFILLDAVLGEVAVETQLGALEMLHPAKAAARGARPLYELREALAARSAEA